MPEPEIKRTENHFPELSNGLQNPINPANYYPTARAAYVASMISTEQNPDSDWQRAKKASLITGDEGIVALAAAQNSFGQGVLALSAIAPEGQTEEFKHVDGNPAFTSSAYDEICRFWQRLPADQRQPFLGEIAKNLVQSGDARFGRMAPDIADKLSNLTTLMLPAFLQRMELPPTTGNAANQPTSLNQLAEAITNEQQTFGSVALAKQLQAKLSPDDLNELEIQLRNLTPSNDPSQRLSIIRDFLFSRAIFDPSAEADRLPLSLANLAQLNDLTDYQLSDSDIETGLALLPQPENFSEETEEARSISTDPRYLKPPTAAWVNAAEIVGGFKLQFGENWEAPLAANGESTNTAQRVATVFDLLNRGDLNFNSGEAFHLLKHQGKYYLKDDGRARLLILKLLAQKNSKQINLPAIVEETVL